MHTFSSKERDAETGLSYFGARYYNSDLSIWLSVDPMASKYPSLSPYTYCAENPVKLVDPNGEELDDIFVNTKTKQVSVIKTNDTYDRVIVDGTYTGNREKGLETSERVQQGYTVNTMNIRYASSSMSKISDYSMSVLIDVMNESDNYSATITSTTRTPEDQVRNDFHMALERNAQIHKCLTPYNSNDPAFHIEIKQQTPVKQPKCILK